VVEVAPQARPKATTRDRDWLTYIMSTLPSFYNYQQFSEAVMSELIHCLILKRASRSHAKTGYFSYLFRDLLVFFF